MRYLIKSQCTADSMLDHLVQAAFHVVEGNVPDSVAEDIRVGFYVAFHQVLAESLVKAAECGTLAGCEDLREESALSTHHAAAGARAQNPRN